MDLIAGFAPGFVRDNRDPKGNSRVRVEIPGYLAETPYWVMPAHKVHGIGRGDQAPPPDVGMVVAVVFEYGIWWKPDSKAFYIGGYHGELPSGASAGPTVPAQAETADKAAKHRVLWESSKLAAYIVDDPDGEDERLVLKAKTSGSMIEINAADGADGHAETISIAARTLLNLYSQGPINIASDTDVYIQGRRVRSLTKAEM